MDKYKRDLKILLAFSLILTIGFCVGIFGIIFGAVKGFSALLIIGIVLTVVGFYGMPIIWLAYGQTKSYQIVLSLILDQNIYSVADISNQLSLNQKNVNAIIYKLIQKEYLVGYIFKNGVLELNRNVKQEKRHSEKIKCPNCSGFMDFDGVNYVCQYCGNVQKKKPL